MIAEGRLATAADAQAVMAAQHDTANAIGIAPWTVAQLAGLAENARLTRPNYYILVAATAPDGSVEGFMSVWRPRNPDQTGESHVTVQLVASRILGDGDDRPRFRRVLVSTFKRLTRTCNQQGLTWEAWFPASVGQAFAVSDFAQQMLAHSQITIAPARRNGVDGFLVRSADVVMDADSVAWPAA